jgi:hypothetical protein
MAWPVTNAHIVRLQNGITTTIAWGTEGMNTYTYIVKSLRAQRLVEEIKIEQGSGLTAIDVLLIDGDQVEVTVIDDTTIKPPDVGSAVFFTNPLNASTASPPWSLGLFQGFWVIDNSYNAARKTEGERVLLCKYFNAMTAPTPP